MTPSGYINQNIKIYQADNIGDSYGGSTGASEALYWSTSASVEQLKARKQLESQQERLKPMWRFKVRYRDDKILTHDMSVVWRGIRFAIQDVEIDYVYKQFISFTAVAGDLAPLGTTQVID